jgi:hypothetical protein
MTTHTRICTCTHGHLSHRYLLSTRANNGRCLGPNCWCEQFEEAK